jgi:hypothetical protein
MFFKRCRLTSVRHCSLIAPVALASLAVSGVKAQAHEQVVDYAIPAGPLQGALVRFAALAGQQLLYTSEIFPEAWVTGQTPASAASWSSER